MRYPQPVPGPAPVKNVIHVIGMLNQIRQDALSLIRGYQQQYGDLFVLQVQGKKLYFTTDAEIIHEVLVKQADKFKKDDDYTDPERGLARFLGSGLLTSNGDFWKRQRKLVAPALHARRIEAYAQTMTDYTTARIASWRDGEMRDIAREMNAITIRIVAKSLFNTEVESEIATVAEVMSAIQEKFMGSPLDLLPTWVPHPAELRARKANQALDTLVYGIIEAWRKHGEDRGDLLSMLLLAETEDGQRMSDKQARDEIVTLFLAGHETTANALNWTWLLLSQNPDARAKLHEELDRVLGGRVPTLADLKNLPYTEMVVKESMRLYPPAWGISREASDDVTLEDFTVHKGESVQIFIYGVHHNPRYWDDPEAFRPERFSEAQEVNIPRYAYLPFGGGPRVCIGNSFAMMEAQLLLATIASRWQITLAPDARVEVAPMITLFPRHGLKMQVNQRTGDALHPKT